MTANINPDAFCWPNSDAANTAELRRMSLRIDLFQRRALPLEQAEQLAERCVGRDRDLDDRRACIECKNFQRGSTCLITKQATLPVTVFHRCQFFGWQVPRAS